MNNFGNKNNTKGFDKNPQNINKEGRPKKIYTIIKEMGYCSDDIKSAYGELAFYSITDLKKMYVDESKPAIARIIANQFIRALNDSDWNKIKEILEHVIGKPQTTIDLAIDQTIKNVNIDLTEEELIEKYNKLQTLMQ